MVSISATVSEKIHLMDHRRTTDEKNLSVGIPPLKTVATQVDTYLNVFFSTAWHLSQAEYQGPWASCII